MKKNLSTLVAVAFLLGSASVGAQNTVHLTGTGATFPYPVYSKWFDEYRKANPQVQINYQSQGSGAGIRQVTEGTVDFSATDGPMNEEQLKAYRDKRGCDILHFPDSLNAMVRADVELARSVLVRDDRVDSLRDQILRELLTYMMENSTVVFPAFELVLVAKNLEPIADHATNIAEDVIYIVAGRDVRHHASDRR